MDEVYLRETLSLYELATLSMEQVTLAGNNVALFLTVTSGYLVAAYFGAEKLEKSGVLKILCHSINLHMRGLTYDRKLRF